MSLKEWLSNWKNYFLTNFICPSNFQKFGILGVFSQKIPLFLKVPKVLQIPPYFKIPLIFPSQIHSDYVIEVNFSQLLKTLKCDALVTKNSFLFLGIKTADCLPILVSTKSKELIGVVHAGWRGSVKGILYTTLKIFLKEGFKPEEILVAIGPHIKSCCYEVKEDLIEELKLRFDNYKNFVFLKEGKIFLSLERLNLFQACELGIPLQNIWTSPDCTFCLNHLYWSHRFHKKYKKYQISFIGKL